MSEEIKGLDSLKFAEYNPRIAVEDFDRKLSNSMDAFGDISGITKNMATGNLVTGHQRIRLLQKKFGDRAKIHLEQRFSEPDELGTVGLGFVGVEGTGIRLNYREVQWELGMEKAANIAANKIEAQWNNDLLAQVTHELSLLDDADYLLGLTGQDEAEVSKLLDLVGVGGEESEAANDAPELDEENPPVSQHGEVYQLGRHRLMCGDSVSESDVQQLLQGSKVAMCFTDPPYNVAYEGGNGLKREGILNDKMGKDDFAAFLLSVCKNLVANCDGAIYICMSPKELGQLQSAFQEAGGYWASTIIWAKNTFTLSGSDYQHAYEPILYGWPKTVTNHYYAGYRDVSDVWSDFAAFKSVFDGTHTTVRIGGITVKVEGEVKGTIKYDKSEVDLWRYNKPTKSIEHPTMKPVELVENAVRNSSLRNEAVLDLFGRSGSTLIACERTDRVNFSMELDPKYCDVIRKRYQKLVTGSDRDWEAFTPVVMKDGQVIEASVPEVVAVPAGAEERLDETPVA